MRDDKIGPQTCASLGPVGQCGDRSQDTQKVATSISLQPKKDTTVQSLDFHGEQIFHEVVQEI